MLGYFCPPYYNPPNLGIIRPNFQKLKTPSKPQCFKTYISIGLIFDAWGNCSEKLTRSAVCTQLQTLELLFACFESWLDKRLHNRFGLQWEVPKWWRNVLCPEYCIRLLNFQLGYWFYTFYKMWSAISLCWLLPNLR